MTDNEELISLTSDIVSAMLSNNRVATAEVPTLIKNVHGALFRVSQPVEEEAPAQEPAVSIRASIKQDYIVCLEDGKKLKMLKRYLRTNYDMTPDEYRAKWKLPRDYPMVAPAYAEQRQMLAHAIGLGKKKPEGAISVRDGKTARKADAKPRGRPKGISAAKKAAQAHLTGGAEKAGGVDLGGS